MKLIVGLGNPGQRYEGTRHNVGFDVIQQLRVRCGIGGIKPKNRFRGELSEAEVDGNRWLLLTPLTFMNLSGDCVAQVVEFYKLSLADVLVVCDDISLTLGTIRLREQGSAGGQRGLNHILVRLGSQQIPRLRIGVGLLPPAWDAADFVLARFAASERSVVEESCVRACEAVECWARSGVKEAMNRFNRSPQNDRKEPS